jgi:hypothetical protein
MTDRKAGLTPISSGTDSRTPHLRASHAEIRSCRVGGVFAAHQNLIRANRQTNRRARFRNSSSGRPIACTRVAEPGRHSPSESAGGCDGSRGTPAPTRVRLPLSICEPFLPCRRRLPRNSLHGSALAARFASDPSACDIAGSAMRCLRGRSPSGSCGNRSSSTRRRRPANRGGSG